MDLSQVVGLEAVVGLADLRGLAGRQVDEGIGDPVLQSGHLDHDPGPVVRPAGQLNVLVGEALHDGVPGGLVLGVEEYVVRLHADADAADDPVGDRVVDQAGQFVVLRDRRPQPAGGERQGTVLDLPVPEDVHDQGGAVRAQALDGRGIGQGLLDEGVRPRITPPQPDAEVAGQLVIGDLGEQGALAVDHPVPFLLGRLSGLDHRFLVGGQVHRNQRRHALIVEEGDAAHEDRRPPLH